jgi:hypothetical protein
MPHIPLYSEHAPALTSASRRGFLHSLGAGFGSLALHGMLQSESSTIHAANVSLAHIAPKAKSCIFLFMFGGPSQLDLFDYKPELQKHDGQSFQNEFRRNTLTEAKLQASRRTFAQHGQSGLWCSDALPHLSHHMDKLAMIHSLQSDSFAHGSALLNMNTGRAIQGHPSLGTWINYGLGSMNRNLPSYVVMLDPRGGPTTGSPNWSNGYMPAAYQGTVLRETSPPIPHLEPPPGTTRDMQREQIDLIQFLNQSHSKTRRDASELEARIESYELAFRLQMTAPEALDLRQEPDSIHAIYGTRESRGPHKLSVGSAPFGKQCLIARRLVERGVRFIQIYSGGGAAGGQNSWDGHHGIEENLAIHCPEIDRPIAGLLQDLDQRGLLEETLVVWGGEFGRQPVSETFNTGGKAGGRDHNPLGFTYWMAGGGVKAGSSYGATDEMGERAVVHPHHLRDLHATILHQMGMDHRSLTFSYGGLDQRLTGVEEEAQVIHGIIKTPH